MAKVRVHELAKEFGVDAKVILRLLEEMGEFVKSAACQVDGAVVARFLGAYGDHLRAGTPVDEMVAQPAAQVVPSVRLPRRTSWDDIPFDTAGRAIWERHGLGEHDARLAMFLLEHGLLPDDLDLMLRGRRAVSRLRGGEEPWTHLAAEMLEARSRVVVERPLPSKVVTRRFKAS